jgi:hypothetical protein
MSNMDVVGGGVAADVEDAEGDLDAAVAKERPDASMREGDVAVAAEEEEEEAAAEVDIDGVDA